MTHEESYNQLKQVKKLQKALDDIGLNADETIYLLKTFKGDNGRIDNELEELMANIRKSVYKDRYYIYQPVRHRNKPIREMTEDEKREYYRNKKRESRSRQNGKTKS